MIHETELNKLREEISELKKCQVDFTRLAILIFGLVVSAIGVLIPNIPIMNADSFKPEYLLVYLSIISLIPIVYPYILWIIIHKCRSIFRIVSYIRIVEEYDIKNCLADLLGYETLHRKLKEHPWLEMRISPFPKLLKRIFRKMRGYRCITLEADKKYNEWQNKNNTTTSNIISQTGLESDKLGPYIGDYYGKLLFFIKLLGSIGMLSLLSLTIYGFSKTDIIWLKILFSVLGIFSILWSLYHFLLSKRYLMELRYRPFSMDAHYDMWNWAINEFLE